MKKLNSKTKIRMFEILAIFATIAAIVNLAMSYGEHWTAGLVIGIVLAIFGYMTVYFFGPMMPVIGYLLRKWAK